VKIQSSHEYKGLRAALLSRGVPPEDLDNLINNRPSLEYEDEPNWSKSLVKPVYKANRSAEAKVFVPKANLVDNWRSNRQSKILTPGSRSCGDECLTTTNEHDENDYFEEKGDYYENNHGDRSLTVKGLSPFATLADVLKHVKGGPILNIFKRSRSAHISFVDPVAAEKFLIYSKHADLYIRGKRVCC